MKRPHSISASEVPPEGVTPPPAAAELPLTRRLIDLLNLLGHGAVIDIASRTLYVNVETVCTYPTPMTALPGRFLEDLEGNGKMFVRLTRFTGSRYVALHALFARWTIALECSASTKYRYVPKAEPSRAIMAALADFPLPASVVVDSGDIVEGIWLLTSPCPLVPAADRARAMQLKLADRLHADPVMAVDFDKAWLPVPGSTIRALGEPPSRVVFATFEPTRRYTVDQIEAALDGDTEIDKPRSAAHRSVPS
jgi:hypothetical protein